MKKIIAIFATAAAVCGCKSIDVPPAGYSQVRTYEYQMAGHPFKSEKGCVRKADIGKFDQKCDVPYLGFGGFTQPDIGSISVGGGSGTGSF